MLTCRLQLHGQTKEAAKVKGIDGVQVSITHSGGVATAIALASRKA
jgi:phosphopantetheinyl transferase (holo-ACP synthase)